MENEPSPPEAEGKQEKGSSVYSTKNQDESVESKKVPTSNAGDDDPNVKVQGKRNGNDVGMDTGDVKMSGTQAQDGGGGKGEDTGDADEKGAKRKQGETPTTVGDSGGKNKVQRKNGGGGN